MLKTNGEVFGSEAFSNGEVSYKPAVVNLDEPNVISLYFQSNKDITDLFFAVEYFRDMAPDVPLILEMLYVPYGRMDREIDGYIYSLKYFSNMINRCNFDKIITLDNHSYKTMNMIDKVVEVDLNYYIDKVVEKFKPDYLYFPDKGAMERYPSLLKVCKDGKIEYFYGQKERVLDDTRTLKYYNVIDNGLHLEGRKVLIIDDICCTGGTVMEAVDVLKRRGVSDICLWVAHCENNIIKYDIVREDSGISKIYTTNSIVRNYHIPEIEVIE